MAITTRRRALVHVTLVAGVLSGCASSDDVPAATDAAFAGLDAATVDEVLDHPAAVALVSSEPDDTRASLAQGIVRNFLVCRDALETYTTWIETGELRPLAPLPMPDQPIEPSARLWESDYAHLVSVATSGDPAGLQEWLTAEGSCGRWIPAEPNRPEGPTIADVVNGLT